MLPCGNVPLLALLHIIFIIYVLNFLKLVWAVNNGLINELINFIKVLY